MQKIVNSICSAEQIYSGGTNADFNRPANLLTFISIMKILNISILKYFNTSIIIAIFSSATFAENIKTNNKNTKPVTSNNKLEINISGTLKNYNGQPVQDGFVMLQNNPRLCTLTDGQGRFKITGKAHSLPDTLLVSWAGCEIAKIPVTQGKIKDLKIQLKAEDPEYTKIEVGGAILATDAGAAHRVKLTKELRKTSRKLTADEKICIAAYKKFLKVKGEKIIKKIITGKKLSADESKYRYLLHAEISSRAGYSIFGGAKKGAREDAYKTYCRPIVAQARKVFAKGYKGERLTADDVETLRLYRAIQAVFKPGNDLVMRPGFAGFKYYANNMIPYPVIGKKIHDCSFFDFETVLQSPDFSNYSSLSLTEFIRLESLADMFARFAGTKLNEEGLLAPKTKKELQRIYWKESEQLITLDEIVASAQKPIAIFWQCYEDRTFPSRAARYAEYLRRAYRDQMEVIVVHSPSPLHGDMYINELRYFGQNPEAKPLSGLNTRFGEEDNTPLRHARTIKVACMENPVISGPIYLENASLHYTCFSVKKKGFGHTPTLLDKNGIKSFGFGAHRALNFEISEQYNNPSPFCKSYAHMWAPYAIIEQELRVLLKNNGVYDAEKMGQSFHLTYPTRHFSPHDQYEFKSYDKKTGILYAAWVKPKTRNHYPIIHRWGKIEPGVEFRFKISPDTRIVLRKKDGKAFWPTPQEYEKLKGDFFGTGPGITRSVSTIEDLRPGDRFFADYIINDKQTKPRRRLCDEIDIDDYRTENQKLDLTKGDLLPGFDIEKYKGKVLDTVRIHNFYDSRGMASNQGPTMGSLMPLYGRITKLDGKVMTVKINADEVKEMHGYKFWKEEAKTASVERSSKSYARNTVPVIMRWAEGTDEDRTYRFALDRAVRITRNGEYENITTQDLCVGDYVFIEYDSFYEKNHQGKGLIYPETVMASSQIK